MIHSRRTSTLVTILGVVVATGQTVGQSPQRTQAVRLQPISPRIERLNPVRDGRGAFEPLRERRTTITVRGIVQNTLGQLVPLAGTVLVRSLTDGTVAGRAEVDALAQFSIRGFASGTYTAELVSRGGALLATTSAFAADAGEVVELVPIVSTAPRSPASSTLQTSTSAIVISAAGSGILAFNTGQPVTPQ